MIRNQISGLPSLPLSLFQCQVGLSYYKCLVSSLVLIITDSKAGDNCCGSGLVFNKICSQNFNLQ